MTAYEFGFDLTTKNDKNDSLEMYTVTLPIAINMKKVKGMFHPVHAHDSFCAALGKTVISWSRFESEFNLFLRALLNLSASNEPMMPKSTSNFNKRIKRCREEIVAQFGQSASLKDYLHSFLDEVAILQFKRNILVHGNVALEFSLNPDKTLRTILEATGRNNGKPISLRFTEEELDSLYYDLGNLSGKMAQISNPEFVLDLPLSLPDKSLLIAFLHKGHPTHASNSTPQSPQST